MPLPLDQVFAIRLIQSPGQKMSLQTSHSNGKGGFDYDLQGLYIAMLKDALRLVETAPVVGGIITQTPSFDILPAAGLGLRPIKV